MKIIWGSNLQHTTRLDLAVQLVDATLADWLYTRCSAMVEFGSSRPVLGEQDLSLQVDSATHLLVDAGMPGQSDILSEATAIVKEARQWVVIGSQFLPTGPMADHLIGALGRGVELFIPSNHPSMYDWLVLVQYLMRLRDRVTRPQEFFAHAMDPAGPLMHAKVAANEQRGIITSHNFAPAGVKFGTVEIAFHRRDPQFAASIRENLQGLVAQALVPAAALAA